MSVTSPANPPAAAQDTSVRPFQFTAPDPDLEEMRRRITGMRWPEKETVTDDSQGVPLATLRELATRCR